MSIKPETARLAVSLASTIKATIEDNLASGACQHGHFDYSLDMERACWACEDGHDRNPYREALDRVRGFEARDARQRIYGVVRFALNSSTYKSDEEILAVLKSAVSMLEEI